ncbi:MAG: FAD-binding oxidoreductase [Gammaproteobacteria bacterium]
MTSQYQLSCGWNDCLPPRVPKEPLTGERTANVVIIGAGFTGIACAKRWQSLAPEDEIVVLEATTVGEGNPGRNSGFLLEIALAEDAEAGRIAQLEAANRLTRAAMASIKEDVDRFGEQGILARSGTYRAAASPIGLAALDRYETFLAAAGLSYRRLSATEMEQELGTRFYQAGLYSPDCYLAQPAAVIRALAKGLPSAVSLYEHSPVVKLDLQLGKWRVLTPHGVITTDKVVLANNAFAAKLGFARGQLASVYTYAGLTPRLPESVLDILGTNQDWGLLPTHRLGSTLRRTSDGRLLIRSLHDYEQERPASSIRSELKSRLHSRFPQLEGVDFEHLWGGAVGFTLNGGLVWGELEPGLFASCGCNGGGTVKGTLLGSLIADKALGQPTPDVLALFGQASWMPPEPFRSVGFHLTSAWESWQGRKEL